MLLLIRVRLTSGLSYGAWRQVIRGKLQTLTLFTLYDIAKQGFTLSLAHYF